jgi:tagatose-1,6-bisphosphate aldolase
MDLSIGKLRRLQQCATPDGFFVIMALDHRNNLRRALNPGNPESIGYAEMVAFKQEVVRALAPVSSAVLLDPEFGAAQAIAAGALPGPTGLMVAAEATGYTDTPTARRSEILEGWGVEKISRMGASAVKLLLYYHPGAKNAHEQEELVREVAVQCHRYDMPFFLEPLSFTIDPDVKKLSSAEKRKVVIETAARLSPLGIDILKAEFPLDTAEEKDERIWAEACRELNDASVVPWVLLSAGVSFDEFVRQTQVACRAGSSGVMAGRAVWQEAVDARETERGEFLMSTGIDRMVQLGDVISEFGTPWPERSPRKVGEIGEDWYIEY